MNTRYPSIIVLSRQVGSSDKDQQTFIIFVLDISMIKYTTSDPFVFFRNATNHEGRIPYMCQPDYFLLSILYPLL